MSEWYTKLTKITKIPNVYGDHEETFVSFARVLHHIQSALTRYEG